MIFSLSMFSSIYEEVNISSSWQIVFEMVMPPAHSVELVHRLFLSQLQSGKMWGKSITISWSLFMQSPSDMPTHSRTMSLLHVSCRSVNLQMG